ncbi:MAG: hypothetical protein IKE94_04035 [Aeriscardovia sp.]|nr:hypothetical protein [Aeriscardovia sp.]
MTIERILIVVLFLLNVRTEVAMVKIIQKHNHLTQVIAVLTVTLCKSVHGLADELDKNMKKSVDNYAEFIKERIEDEQDD